jgi:hypothetical protein
MPELRPIEFWQVGQLELDPRNPRLPAHLADASQVELLRHFEEEYDLDELAWSMVEKGYFDEEPLLTIAKEGDAATRVVIEGNRRLATLKLLTDPAASRRPQRWDELAEQAGRHDLREVPTWNYERRNDLLEYLGFRHVSGLLPWEAEAKARYVHALVLDHGYSFSDAAKVIGSRADAIRRQFIAWRSLEQARAADVDVAPAVDHFGVYYRSLQSPGVRAYLMLSGWSDGTEQTLNPLSDGGTGRLAEYLTYVFGDRRVIRESRQLDDLGRALADPRAAAILRDSRDLAAALQEIPSDRDAVVGAIRQAYRQAARATAEAWQFRGDEELQAEARRLRGQVEQLIRSLEPDAEVSRTESETQGPR